MNLRATARWVQQRWRCHPVLLTWLALAVPLVVVAVVLLGKHWHPVLDLAMTEFRVRDVGTRHTPLIGLPGRIGVFPDQGSHPGPLSFYLLAPMYRLLGSSAWGLLVGMIVLNLVAVAGALAIAWRRGGARLVLVVALVLVVVLRGYGSSVLEQPWNPYLPVLGWMVVLLAVWSVLEGDLMLVVVATAVGSLCAQTHIPYLPLAVGMLGLCAVKLVLVARRQPERRREVCKVTFISVVVAALIWLPVFIDQIRHTPGNLSMLKTHFTNPPAAEPPVGWGEGMRLLFRHLDVVRLVRLAFGGDGYFVRAGYRLDGSVVPGLLVLLVWCASVVVARRLALRAVLALDVVIGWSLVLGAASMARIFGKVWYYLTLWMWVTTVLVAVAIVTTAVAAIPRLPRRDGGLRMLAWVVGVASLVAFTVGAASATAPEQNLSDSLGALIAPTVRALDNNTGGATGHRGRYTVTYADALYFGEQAYGLVSELERRGFTAGMPQTWHVPVTQHRVITEADATAQLRLATGSKVASVAALPGAVEIARVDLRDDAGRVRYATLHQEVSDALTADGLVDLVPMLDENLFGLQLDARVSPTIQAAVNEMLQLGDVTAVFVLPAATPI